MHLFISRAIQYTYRKEKNISTNQTKMLKNIDLDRLIELFAIMFLK